MHIKQEIKNFYFPPSFSIIISLLFFNSMTEKHPSFLILHFFDCSQAVPFSLYIWHSYRSISLACISLSDKELPHFFLMFWWTCMCTKPFQSQPILWDHMDYRLPGSSVHGILQARILEWVAMTISRNWHAKYFLLLLLLFSCSVVRALWDAMDCSTPGFPVLHHLPELVQTHVHWVSDAI